MNSLFEIAGRRIGENQPPYIIAEMSGNHGGSLDRALEIIEAAKACGADAIKFQTYTPDTITIDCDQEAFIVKNPLWQDRTLYELYGEAHTPFEWHQSLFAKAREVGITAFSTPFDFSAVELLESLQAPAYKIASSELVDVNLIRRVADTGKPIILSTGMATFAEIEEAVAAVESTGNSRLYLLHCVAGYPTPVEESHLNKLNTLKDFGYPVGLSDHSPGTDVAVIAAAMGAVMIEKHFCLSRQLKTVDSEFSLEPDELRALAAKTRQVVAIQGAIKGNKDDIKTVEADSRRFRRSLFAVADIASGELFTEKNIRSIRPATGLHPRYFHQLLGKKSKRFLARGTPLSDQDLS